MSGAKQSSSSSFQSPHAVKSSVSGTVESSVTRLLVSTKHLLESLTQWTRHEVDDRFVSDAYVKLGNDFRAVIRAFNNAHVDVSDIGDVPKALRIVLESALSEPPSQESLDRFLPSIRNIIVNLLQNLKKKQLLIKEIGDNNKNEESENSSKKVSSRTTHKSTTYENIMDVTDDGVGPMLTEEVFGVEKNSSVELGKNDALKQLQESKAISRRASKRFSAYQYAKLANASKVTLPSMSRSSNDERPQAVTVASNSVDGSAVKRSVTAFLTLGLRTKKVILEKPVTMSSIRLSFVQCFAYSPGSTSFPDIYVRQQEVSYELEDHLIETELVDGVNLVLMDLAATESTPEKLLNKVDKLVESLASFKENVQEDLIILKDKINHITQAPKHSQTLGKSNDISKVQKDLEELSRDLKALTHIQDSRKGEVSRIVISNNQLTSRLKESIVKQSLASGRSYMESSYTKLSGESDSLLTKVDDLSDMMEALRKDVAQRGVRIGQKQLKSASQEIDSAKQALHSLREYIELEKPTWKRIWEQELDKVCEEQQFLALQDDLTSDLSEDIKKIEETLDLIERCSNQQERMNVNKRNDLATRLYFPDNVESLHGIKDAVLSEVASLVPNHTNRLEAIAKAERVRSKEREMMQGDQFQEELGEFVSENRLKKSGGIEELERSRKERDEENLKASFGLI